jgi:hypothetical protein
MANVLVLAEDRCVGFTCAEVLRHSGFQASVGSWPAGAGASTTPDIILAWDASEANARLIRAAHKGVPLLVCAWPHRQDCHLPGVGIVPLPFNAERVTRVLTQTLRRPGASPRSGAPLM